MARSHDDRKPDEVKIEGELALVTLGAGLILQKGLRPIWPHFVVGSPVSFLMMATMSFSVNVV